MPEDPFFIIGRINRLHPAAVCFRETGGRHPFARLRGDDIVCMRIMLDMAHQRLRAEMIGMHMGDDDEFDVVERGRAGFHFFIQFIRRPLIVRQTVAEERIEEHGSRGAVHGKARIGDMADFRRLKRPLRHRGG